METIQAAVNARLLSKANRLFTGTLDGRIVEILQNARRAGATEVVITNQDGRVTVRDNGRGIGTRPTGGEFARLLDLGGSGWDSEVESSEDPAGVGLFCLAPRGVTVCSQGRMVTIAGDGWTGAPVEIRDDPEPVSGAVLQFEDEPWTSSEVDPRAVFSGLQVIVDGQACPRLPFVSDQAVACPELGCRIEVRQVQDLEPWHISCSRNGYSRCNALVNFHGQVVSFDWHPVSEHGLHYLVDLTGEPTGIRLMLPARTRLVENGALAQLKDTLQREALRYLQRRGHHRLPYKEFLYARRRGIDLPEAEPTFRVGLLANPEPPEPIEVRLPEGFPLERCCRFDPNDPQGAETDEANAHLLAALGTLDEPVVPVDIQQKYDGYSWAGLPTIGKVELRVGEQLHSASVWSGTLTCVDSLEITVHTSDGKVFCSAVCMALAPPPDKGPSWAEDHVLVTPEARQRLSALEIWHHLGGWWEDGDSYDTQEGQFEQELDRFWADVVGPDEHLRRTILSSLAPIKRKWKSVTISAAGAVTIHHVNGSRKTLKPSSAT